MADMNLFCSIKHGCHVFTNLSFLYVIAEINRKRRVEMEQRERDIIQFKDGKRDQMIKERERQRDVYRKSVTPGRPPDGRHMPPGGGRLDMRGPGL